MIKIIVMMILQIKMNILLILNRTIYIIKIVNYKKLIKLSLVALLISKQKIIFHILQIVRKFFKKYNFFCCKYR
jgi:hypothetical protein